MTPHVPPSEAELDKLEQLLPGVGRDLIAEIRRLRKLCGMANQIVLVASEKIPLLSMAKAWLKFADELKAASEGRNG